MILNTFMYLFQTNTPWSSTMPWNDGKSFGNSNGSTFFDITWRNNSAGFWESNLNGWYLRIGASDSEVIYESGGLVEPITTLTNLNASTSSNIGKMLRSVTASFRNDTNDVIVVKEIGIGISSGAYDGESGHSGKTLFARKVLESPVTIQSGETYSFTYAITT